MKASLDGKLGIQFWSIMMFCAKNSIIVDGFEDIYFALEAYDLLSFDDGTISLPQQKLK